MRASGPQHIPQGESACWWLLILVGSTGQGPPTHASQEWQGLGSRGAALGENRLGRRRSEG